MATKSIKAAPQRPAPQGENLVFLKQTQNISAEESALLAVASLNGNDVLEEADFRDPRAKKLLANYQVPQKPLPWSRELVLMKAAERIIRPPFPQLLTDLLKEAIAYMRYSSLASAVSLIGLVARIILQAPLTPDGASGTKALFRTLMYLSEFYSLNELLRQKGEVTIFSEEFDNRMKEVVWMITRGKIRLQVQTKYLNEQHATAMFDPRIDKFGGASFIVPSENFPDDAIIHEAIHVAQHIKGDSRPAVDGETEAFAMSSHYLLARYGPLKARQIMSAWSDDHPDRDRRPASEILKVLDGIVAPAVVARINRFVEIASYAYEQARAVSDKYKTAFELSLDYAELRAARSRKANEALQLLKQAIVVRYGAREPIRVASSILRFPRTGDIVMGFSKDNFITGMQSLIDEMQRMQPELSGYLNFNFDFAEALQSAVERADMVRARQIIDQRYLPKLWRFSATHPSPRVDWSELRKDSPFLTVNR